MAHNFLKAEVITATALGLLEREIVLPQLFRTYTLNDFRYAKDDTINIPILARLVAREFALRATGAARQITTDDLVEDSVPVKLDKVAYSAVDITDEQLTLDIKDFGRQVLTPQVRALAEKFESYVYNRIASGSYVAGVNSLEWDTDDEEVNAYSIALRARRVLGEANAPVAGRFLLVGPGAEERILDDKKFIPSQDNDGFGVSALREAQIGNIAQMRVVISNLVAPDEMYACTPEAFVLGNVAPAVPAGVSFGQAQSFQNLSMRWVRDYDSSIMTDRSVLSTFAGTAEIKDGVQPATRHSAADWHTLEANPTVGQRYNARAVKIKLV